MKRNKCEPIRFFMARNFVLGNHGAHIPIASSLLREKGENTTSFAENQFSCQDPQPAKRSEKDYGDENV